MKIVITPAKRMNDNIDYIDVESLPVFLPQTEELLGILKTLKVDEVKKMLGCNDQIAQIAYLNYQMMDLKKDTVPALLAYEGIQYTNTAAHVLTDDDYEYTKQHLRILSGFYGILRPFDGVVPYRLELNNKLSFGKYRNLYEFWGNKIYQELIKDDKNGYLVSADDEKELYLKINTLLLDEELRKHMCINALNSIKEYTIENMVKVHKNVIYKID